MGGLTPVMWIRSEVIDTILAHARRDSPQECCGLLIGNEREVVEAVPTVNTAEDPLRRFQISPLEQLRQVRRCRELATHGEADVDVVGAYHSHPGSAPIPSPSDLEEAFEEFLFVIAGPTGASAEFEVRAYRFRAGRFEEVQLTPPPTGGEV